jgi:hypothetical protein
MNVIVSFDRAIRDEIDQTIRILIRLRQVLEGEINEVLNSAHPGVPKGALTQLKEIASCLNSLTDAKVRLDRSAKTMADAMSVEDELEAVRAYVRAMDPRKRMTFLDGEIQWLSQHPSS